MVEFRDAIDAFQALVKDAESAYLMGSFMRISAEFGGNPNFYTYLARRARPDLYTEWAAGWWAPYLSSEE